MKDDFILTPDQKIAFDKVIRFFNDKKAKMFLISGFAGSGKTFLASRLVEFLSEDFSNKIIMTAPTHKAVRVLKNEMNIEYLNVDFATIHSAFGLREFIDGYGNLKFIPDKMVKPKIDNFNILVIDESSMLDDDLFYRIQKKADSKLNLKVLFIGDQAQIPPINRLDSLPFNLKMQKTFNIESHQFTEIIRQKVGHPIIELASDVRNNLFREETFPVRKNEKTEIGSVRFLDYKKEEEEFITLLHKYFTAKEFKDDGDYARVLAWTNNTVDNFNEILRSMIFDNPDKKILPNEKIIMNSPWIINDKVLFNNNDELEVIKTSIHNLNIPSIPTMKYYETNVRKKELNDRFVFGDIKIIHEDSELVYENHLEVLKKIAKKEQQGSFNARKKWIKYYEVANIFAHYKLAYALTAHKCQGSSYKNVFMINFDLEKNRKIKEKNRIKYTVMTRPVENLFIIV